MNHNYTLKLLTVFLAFFFQQSFAQPKANASREHLLMDFGWRFSFGHPSDTKKDFDNGTGYFSYLAKAGYGDGPAAAGFDDRSWRKLDLPHDWAVEQGFDPKASFSHGFKAIGRNFPDASIGWYRKSFKIPAGDLGRRIHIAFDGVFRNSIVWVNGHYLGVHPSGYLGFDYDITDYLNYGGDNVVSVRVDATMEEGWFYEGAGIYRHVWLNKLDDLHIVPDGTYVNSQLKNNSATITAESTLINEGKSAKSFSISQEVLDAEGKKIASGQQNNLVLKPYETRDFSVAMQVSNPKLWSLENPYLHKLITTIKQGEDVLDRYETTFGIRTMRFDVNQGFFLNGKHVKLKGSNNHQDHAGVGAAMPDGLQDFRITTLKKLGSNAYRCSHNPPTPELLDACDRLGMLVIDENRLMGITPTHLLDMKRLMLRDRNHPSVISWSIGNEEWGIEGNITGARIAATMQTFVKSIDTTRFVTKAVSGGVGNGISTVIDVMGYNYIATKNTDEHHKKFPWQMSWGTEEGSTVTSRGIYVDDKKNNQLASYDKAQNSHFYSLEKGWKHYAERDYLAGMFIWTGFDYRGEPTPFSWPSTGSYFGMVDQCGFDKDYAYYLRSWWGDQPTIHVFPHWNWAGKEGQEIPVWVYSNADEVELFLNNKTLGRKIMEKNGHLEWSVKYTPGTLRAQGYKNGKATIKDEVKTTGASVSVGLASNLKSINANREDIAMITVDLKDKNGLRIPTATNEISFTIEGPGKIIGLGNGDPISLEKDRFFETISTVNLSNLKEKIVGSFENLPETAAFFDDSNWQKAFTDERTEAFAQSSKYIVYRSSFDLKESDLKAAVTLFYNSIGKQQSIFVNGKELAKNLPENRKGDTFKLDPSILKAGTNSIVIVTTPLFKRQSWESVNSNPGLIQVVKPAEQWKRKLFSGLAQVIVQSTGESGEITLTAKASGLKPVQLKIQAQPAKHRPVID
ncbi:MAG: glycoside hydrolase family 2 protein [Sphingobacteriaceae bacterium]|nr:glycoside hydrolase family 2 protein [Sphingobacteriaceae bacterium]